MLPNTYKVITQPTPSVYGHLVIFDTGPPPFWGRSSDAPSGPCSNQRHHSPPKPQTSNMDVAQPWTQNISHPHTTVT